MSLNFKLALSLGTAYMASSTPTPTVQQVVVLGPGSTEWTVPAGTTSIDQVDALGEGGNGYSSSGTNNISTGGGGGAGAFASIATFANWSPGDILELQVGTGGTEKATFLKDNTGTVVAEADYGRNARGATGGDGGLASNSTGTTTNNGGSGGDGIVGGGTRGGAGGGGAASATGAGTDGGTVTGSGAGKTGGDSGSGLSGSVAGTGAQDGTDGADGTEVFNVTGRVMGSGSGAAGATSQRPGGNSGQLGAGGGGGGKTNSSGEKPGGAGGGGYLAITYTAPAAATKAYSCVGLIGQSEIANGRAEDGTPVNHPLVDHYVNWAGPSDLYPNAVAGDYQTIITDSTYLAHPEAYPGAAGDFGWTNPGLATLAEIGSTPILGIPCGEGGTTLVNGTAPWAVGNTLYNAAVAAHNDAVPKAKTARSGSTLDYIVVQLGETDAGNSVTGAAFQTAWLSLLDDFRTDVIDASDSTAYIVGGMVPELITLPANGTSGYEIDIVHRRSVFLRPNCIYVPSPLLSDKGDNTHLRARGATIKGRQRLAREIAMWKQGIKRLLYDFADDEFGETRPLGTSDVGNTVTPDVSEIASVAMAGATSKYLTASGTISATDFMQVILEGYDASITDQAVTWNDCFNSAGLQGITVRSQTGQCVVSGTAYGKQGYQLLIDQSGSWVLYRLDATSRTSLASGSLAAVAGRKFRVSAIGTTIAAAYSDDGGATWTALGSATDSTYSSGQAAAGQFNGTTAGSSAFDNIELRDAI